MARKKSSDPAKPEKQGHLHEALLTPARMEGYVRSVQPKNQKPPGKKKAAVQKWVQMNLVVPLTNAMRERVDSTILRKLTHNQLASVELPTIPLERNVLMFPAGDFAADSKKGVGGPGYVTLQSIGHSTSLKKMALFLQVKVRFSKETWLSAGDDYQCMAVFGFEPKQGEFPSAGVKTR